MNKLKFFSVALLASTFVSQAQDINQAKKWYRKAANQGHPIAIGKLRALQ